MSMKYIKNYSMERVNYHLLRTIISITTFHIIQLSLQISTMSYANYENFQSWCFYLHSFTANYQNCITSQFRKFLEAFLKITDWILHRTLFSATNIFRPLQENYFPQNSAIPTKKKCFVSSIINNVAFVATEVK